jgi:hypothetical protein
MTDFNQATEMLLAFAAMLRDLESRLDPESGLPSDSGENLDSYQLFMSQMVLLQKHMEDFIENAVTLELSLQDMPVQILDFSAEWERFEKP